MQMNYYVFYNTPGDLCLLLLTFVLLFADISAYLWSLE